MNKEKDIIPVDRRIQIRRTKEQRKDERRSIRIKITLQRRVISGRRTKNRRTPSERRAESERRHITTEVLYDKRFALPLPRGENE